MPTSFNYIKSDPVAILFEPPISPTDISYIQFFYPDKPIIKFPYTLKIGFINTIENSEYIAVFKTQITSYYLVLKILTIEEFHEINLKTIYRLPYLSLKRNNRNNR